MTNSSSKRTSRRTSSSQPESAGEDPSYATGLPICFDAGLAEMDRVIRHQPPPASRKVIVAEETLSFTLGIVDLPVAPDNTFALIALNCATTIKAVLDLGNGFFAVPQGVVSLPDSWRTSIGSVGTEEVERAGLVLLAQAPSAASDQLDAVSKPVQDRVGTFFWGLLATGHLRYDRDGVQLTGANVGGRITVHQHASTPYIRRLDGIVTAQVSEKHLRHAAGLAAGRLTLSARPDGRRVKLALGTFLKAFSENDLGQRIHQLVRVTCDGFTKEAGRNKFKEKARLFVTSDAQADTCRELYLIRNNAEHFNTPPDRGLNPIPLRESLERAYRLAHQAESLARYCVSRFVDTPRLWPYWDNDDTVDEFWSLQEQERRRLWGAPFDLDAAVASFMGVTVPGESA